MSTWFYGNWLHDFVATWPPRRRWSATGSVIAAVVALWWALSFCQLRQSLMSAKNDVNQLEHCQHELAFLSQKLESLGQGLENGHTPLSLSEILIDCAIEAELELEHTIMSEGSSNLTALVLECQIRGSFEKMINFLSQLHSKKIFLLKCNLTRVSDKTLKGVLLLSDQPTKHMADQ